MNCKLNWSGTFGDLPVSTSQWGDSSNAWPFRAVYVGDEGPNSDPQNYRAGTVPVEVMLLLLRE